MLRSLPNFKEGKVTTRNEVDLACNMRGNQINSIKLYLTYLQESPLCHNSTARTFKGPEVRH
jgi:hypothetical protein